MLYTEDETAGVFRQLLLCKYLCLSSDIGITGIDTIAKKKPSTPHILYYHQPHIHTQRPSEEADF